MSLFIKFSFLQIPLFLCIELTWQSIFLIWDIKFLNTENDDHFYYVETVIHHFTKGVEEYFSFLFVWPNIFIT